MSFHQVSIISSLFIVYGFSLVLKIIAYVFHRFLHFHHLLSSPFRNFREFLSCMFVYHFLSGVIIFTFSIIFITFHDFLSCSWLFIAYHRLQYDTSLLFMIIVYFFHHVHHFLQFSFFIIFCHGSSFSSFLIFSPRSSFSFVLVS